VGGNPVRIALGFALGVFLGVFPTFGIGIPLSLLFASLFRWNRVSAVLGSLVMNPLTTPFFWTLSGAVGAAIFRTDASRLLASVQNGERLRGLTLGAGIYLAGNTIVALVTAMIAYFLASERAEAETEVPGGRRLGAGEHGRLRSPLAPLP
jgi:uncharacterized protein (DUF2062 family)